MFLSGRLFASLLLVSCLLLAAAPPAVAANGTGINFTISAVAKATFSISGIVRADATSLGVAGVSVVAASTTGQSIDGYTGVAGTDASGAYTINHLLPGSYTLRLVPPREADLQGGYRSVAGPGFFSPTTASPVAIVAASIGGLDVRLPTGYRISGKVIRSSVSTPIVDVDVRATSLGHLTDVFDETWTDSAGNYTLMGLGPGSYQINFLNDPDLDSQTGCWYAGAVARFSAGCVSRTPVGIAASDVTGISPRIGNTVRIVGHVMSRTTPPVPIAGAMVAPVLPPCNDCTFGSAGETDASGKYTVIGLNPGSYRLAVSDPGHHRDGFYAVASPYNWTTSSAGASLVTASGATTTVAVMKPAVGYFISGNVANTSGSPIRAVQVTYVDGAGRTGNLAASTDAAGNYSLGPVAPGDYRIRGNAAYLVNPIFQSGWYMSSPPGNFTPAAAATSTVHVAGDVGGINMRLPLGASISGTVRLTGGSACASCFVQALDLAGQQVAFTATSGSGAYILRGLSPGSYLVSASAGSAADLGSTHIQVITDGFYKAGAVPNFSATQLGATAVAVSP
jgi:large repetitive protein